MIAAASVLSPPSSPRSLTEIPRSELRGVVERLSVARAAGSATTSGRTVSALGVELAICAQMFEALAGTSRDDIWQLRPTWAWVWTAEAADPASWARGIRWAQQIAARRSDPAPLARFLAQFAARRGAGEARARLADVLKAFGVSTDGSVTLSAAP